MEAALLPPQEPAAMAAALEAEAPRLQPPAVAMMATVPALSLPLERLAALPAPIFGRPSRSAIRQRNRGRQTPSRSSPLPDRDLLKAVQRRNSESSL